jgi:hypothetical protein
MRLPWLLCLLPLCAAWGQEVPLTNSAPPLVGAPLEQPLPSLLPPSVPVFLQPGMKVRIALAGGQRHAGEVISLLPDSLWLQAGAGPALNLRLTEVERLELKQRSAEEGAVVGFGVGSVAGGIFLAVLCSDAEEKGKNSVGGCASIGSLLGGLLGAGAGALVGLLVPHWSTLYEKGEQGPLSLRRGDEPRPAPREPEALPPPHFVGEVGGALGQAQDRGHVPSNRGWGGRLHLLALLGRHAALGPEAAWYSHIGSRTTVASGQRVREAHSLLQLGGLLRIGTEFGATRASLLAGLAFYDNQSGHAGASVGGEVEMRLWKPLPPLALDVRYHVNLEEAPAHPDPDVLTFGLGTRVRW